MTNPIVKVKGFFTNQERDRRYFKILVVSGILFVLCCVQVITKVFFSGAERAAFQFFNDWPQVLHAPMIIITQFGSLYGLVFWAILGWKLVSRRAAFTIILAALSAWFLGDLCKIMFSRSRPLGLLQGVHIFKGQTFTGYGFPSGHSTLVAACVVVLFYQLKPAFRPYLLIAMILVGISRMFLGAHFPSDVIGGWALGSLTAAIVMLTFGSSKKVNG